jgi:hypothetical protein
MSHYNEWYDYGVSSNTMFIYIKSADSLSTGILELDLHTGDSLKFSTLPLNDSLGSLSTKMKNNKNFIYRYYDSDKLSIINLDSNKVIVDSIPIPITSDPNIYDNYSSTYKPAVRWWSLNDNKIIYQIEFTYPEGANLNGPPSVVDTPRTYRKLVVHDYSANQVVYDTTLEKSNLLSVDTLGRVILGKSDSEWRYKPKEFRWEYDSWNHRLLYLDTRNGNLNFDTLFNELTLGNYRDFRKEDLELSPNGSYYAALQENSSNLLIGKVENNKFINAYQYERNEYSKGYKEITRYKWNTNSTSVFVDMWYSINDEKNHTAIYDLSTKQFIKSFEFGMDARLVDSYVIYKGGGSDTISCYSSTSIPTSVVLPIDNEAFNELLKKNKNVNIYDLNGNEIKFQSNRIGDNYSKLNQGSYFIRTENKTYKIIKE